MNYNLIINREELLTDEVKNNKRVYQLIINCGLVPQCLVNGNISTKYIPIDTHSTKIDDLWISDISYDISVKGNIEWGHTLFVDVELVGNEIKITNTSTRSNMFDVKVILNFTRENDQILSIFEKPFIYITDDFYTEYKTDMRKDSKPIYKMLINLQSSIILDICNIKSAWLDNSYYYNSENIYNISDKVFITSITDDDITICLEPNITNAFTTLFYTKKVDMVCNDFVSEKHNTNILVSDYSGSDKVNLFKNIDEVNDNIQFEQSVIVNNDGFVGIYINWGIYLLDDIDGKLKLSLEINHKTVYQFDMKSNQKFDIMDPTCLYVDMKNIFQVRSNDVVTLVITFDGFTGKNINLRYANILECIFIPIKIKHNQKINPFFWSVNQEVVVGELNRLQKDLGKKKTKQEIYGRMNNNNNIAIDKINIMDCGAVSINGSEYMTISKSSFDIVYSNDNRPILVVNKDGYIFDIWIKYIKVNLE